MKKILLITLLFSGITTMSQEKKDTSFLKKIWGNPTKSSITFMPFGTHYTALEFNGVYFLSYNYKTIELSAFRNSFQELTFGLTYKRMHVLSSKVSLITGLGIMYGYHGKLKEVETVPLRKTFLFSGEINPLGAVVIDYKLSNKVRLNLAITPAVAVYGVRYIL